MPWYEAKVTPDGALGKIGRELPMIFYDGRDLTSLHQTLKETGAIEVERASAERRVESRGMMILRDPHVMVIMRRRDLDFKHPDGPPPFVMRNLSKKLNPPIEPGS